MIDKIRWCYCCEEPTKEYKVYNGVYLCNDCNDFVLALSDCCKNCGGQHTETIKVSGSSGKLYESEICLNCNQSKLLEEL